MSRPKKEELRPCVSCGALVPEVTHYPFSECGPDCALSNQWRREYEEKHMKDERIAALEAEVAASRGPSGADAATLEKAAVALKQEAFGWKERAELAEAKVARLERIETAARALVTVADECIDARERRLQGGGQQVGYHGPLCAAVPSVLRDLKQMVAPLRATLEAKRP